MKKIIILLTLVLVCLDLSSSPYQTMGIPAGQYVSFLDPSLSGSDKIQAYCLEFHKKTPEIGVRFNSFNGEVEINFPGFRSEKMTLQQAVNRNYIAVEGDNSYAGLKIIRKNSSVLGVNFLENAVANHDSNLKLNYLKAFSKQFKDILDTAGGKHVDAIQRQIWKSPKTVFDSSKQGAFSVFSKYDYDSKKNIHMDYIKLNSGGSATICKDTKGNIYLIDSGKSEADAIELMKIISEKYKKTNVKINVIVTHPDADHIGGLKYMLKKRFTLDEIILPNAELGTTAVGKINKFDTVIVLGHGYHKSITASNKIISYSKSEFEDTEAIRKLWNTTYTRTSQTVISFDSNITTKLFQYKNPQSVNDHSIMSWFFHNGVSHLNMGDVGIIPIRGLLADIKLQESELKRKIKEMNEIYNELEAVEKLEEIFRLEKSKISIKSTVLQWPHHHWLPSWEKPSELYVLEQFLLEVDPQFLVVTKPPAGAGQDLKRLQKFLSNFNKKYSKGIKIKELEDEGNLMFISDLFWLNSSYCTV